MYSGLCDAGLFGPRIRLELVVVANSRPVSAEETQTDRFIQEAARPQCDHGWMGFWQC